MGFRGPRLLGGAVADGRPAGDQGRPVGFPRPRDGARDGGRVVAVDAQRPPAGGLEALHLIDRVGQGQGAVDGDAVVVEQDDEAAQPEVPGEGDRLLADAFHEIAVGGQHVGVVVDEIVAELGVEHALGEGHADGRGEPLAERPGGGLDAGRHEVLRVPRRLRVELAEALQLVEAHAGDARQMQERVEQHGAVPGRQDEAVAVRPARVGGIVFEEPREQHRGDVGGAHRQAGMAGFRLLDGVHGEGAYGTRQIGMSDAIGRGGFEHENDPQGKGRPRKRAPEVPAC